MKPVSKTDLPGPVSRGEPPEKPAKLFSGDYKIARVTDLFRGTERSGWWRALCQQNAAMAVNLSDTILERESLLAQTKKGVPVNQERLELLTARLREKGMPEPLFSNETLLIMNLVYQNQVLAESIAGYGQPGKSVFPLKEITTLLGFDIRVKGLEGTAKGSFISPDQTFDLDLPNKRLYINGVSRPIPEDSVFLHDGSIYVTLEVLSAWFPADFKTNYQEMSIAVSPKEKLPFQERLERALTPKNRPSKSLGEPRLPRDHDPYQLIETPFTDLSISASHTDYKKVPDETRHHTSLLSKGDLGYMSSEIYLSHDDEESLNTARFSLERSDPDENLLGPLSASRIAIGDITTPSFPALSGYRTEPGLYIGKRDLSRSQAFDTTRFEGALPPGWDVEVYRNGMLVGSMRVQNDGRYRFDEIPVYYGINDFELLFYGPQGQKQTETRRITVGADMLKQGEHEFDLALSRKNSELFDVNDDEPPMPDENSLKLTSRFEKGVSDRLTLGGGVSSQEVAEQRRTYLNAGFKGNLLGLSVNGEYVKDTEGGDAVEGLLQTKAGPFQLRLKQSLFNDFSDDMDREASDRETAKTDLSLIGAVKRSGPLPEIPFSLTYRGVDREESHEETISASMASTMRNLFFHHLIGYRKNVAIETEEEETGGYFQIANQTGPVRLRGHMDYELDPGQKITGLEVSNLFQMTQNTSSELIFRKELDDAKRTTSAIRLNWNNGRFILSPELSYSNDDIFTALLTLNTTFGREPRNGDLYMSPLTRADSGNLSARVFLDKNNNTIFDTEDTPLEGVRVDAAQAFRQGETGKGGTAFVTGLQKYRPTDVTIDKSTLEDPFFEPRTEGKSIVPRPGHTHLLDFPVILTGEIDGTLRGKGIDGKETPLADIRVQLVDADGKIVQEVRSEYDGFYLFMKVPPGGYQVRIHPDDLREERLQGAPSAIHQITSQGNVVSGLNLLAEPEKPAKERIALAKRPEERDREEKPSPSAERGGDSTLTLYGKEGWVHGTDTREKSVPLYRNGQWLYGEKEPVSKTEIVRPPSDTPQESAITASGDRFGLHLSSYRTPEKAAAGIRYLQEKYPRFLSRADFSIQRVDLGPEKGVWHRVMAGSFASKREAEALGVKIKMAHPYCLVVKLADEKSGVHLTSFRTRKKAMMSIDELKEQYPDLLKKTPFSIVRKDLGPEKGVYQRVVAGQFDDPSEAKALARKIKLKEPYCLPMPIQKKSEQEVHLASFKTASRAAAGLKILQYRLRDILKERPLFIRRVDLGDKGVFYRILAGRFDDLEEAKALRDRIREKNHYAAIIR